MSKIKPVGYWKKWENYQQEMRRVVDRLGHFPTQKELFELSSSSLAWAAKFHGGADVAKQRMGFKTTTKPRGYWQSWENTERELVDLTEQLGHFPTQKEIQKYGRGLGSSLYSNFGGLEVVREKMGFDLLQKPKGHWGDIEKVTVELNSMVQELGHFPSQRDFKKMKRHGLLNAINKYYQGINSMRKILGIPSNGKPRGYWQSWENVEAELKLITTRLGHFPSEGELLNLRRSILIAATHNYHGGFLAARRRMGYSADTKPAGYWQDKKNFFRELSDVIQRVGHFPSQKDLIELNHQDLARAIEKHYGGYPAVRERMGYKTPTQQPSLLEQYAGAEE